MLALERELWELSPNALRDNIMVIVRQAAKVSTMRIGIPCVIVYFINLQTPLTEQNKVFNQVKNPKILTTSFDCLGNYWEKNKLRRNKVVLKSKWSSETGWSRVKASCWEISWLRFNLNLLQLLRRLACSCLMFFGIARARILYSNYLRSAIIYFFPGCKSIERSSLLQSSSVNFR